MMGLDFINADVIARENWPAEAAARSYDAAILAAQERTRRFQSGSSFVTETVFSHPSKLELVREAQRAGFLVKLYIIVVPEDLAVHRVRMRVRHGGHDVPEDKIRGRYQRLWAHLLDAINLADSCDVLDNSSAKHPYRRVIRYRNGVALGAADWPSWAPTELVNRQSGKG